MVQPLATLTCFAQIESIVPIVEGLSSQCYRVHADNRIFFAKQTATTNETTISLLAGSHYISPKVIYHDQHWLITEFIEGESLATIQQTIEEKIVIAMKLMSKCHQIAAKPVELVPISVAHSLINNAHFSSQQQSELLQFSNQITAQIKHDNNLVCCHGDMNFSNMLIDQARSTYLVDFECNCSAPIEYDLAMFIAVNNIARDKITFIIKHYQEYSLTELDLPLLNHYLQFSYLINGLWYINTYHKTKLKKFRPLAKQQWQNIHGFNISIFCL